MEVCGKRSSDEHLGGFPEDNKMSVMNLLIDLIDSVKCEERI